MIKLVQFGDLHLDSVFEASSPEKAAARRKASRQLLYDAVDYAANAGADIILCTGDLFDTVTPYYETLQNAVDAFSRVSIPVFIAPGNHDPYIKNSPYTATKWSENVHIFKEPDLRSVVLQNLGVKITGCANTEIQQSTRPLELYEAENDGYTSLLVMHGESASGETKYMNIPPEDIKKASFDYIALGHIHMHSAKKIGKTTLVQNGSMEGRGYEEPGEKGLIYAEISDKSTDVKLVPLGGSRCVRGTVDISGLSSVQIIKKIRELTEYPPQRTVLRTELTGFGAVDENALLTEFSDFQSVKIVDKTSDRSINEVIADENSLKGIFIKNITERINRATTEREKETAEKALVFGLAALETREQPRTAVL